MQNNYEMIRMCILTFGLAGLSWEDMRKQELHGWAILLLGMPLPLRELRLLVCWYSDIKTENPSFRLYHFC